ncbi:MAG: cob(I)yrinic acid a,c-diamide adenosyltransferase [Chloroflexota bacterium]|nr:MAG: cob(I)yrinic acid a,c-diamide adenosyltransferase [Chloroflexota bacterium]
MKIYTRTGDKGESSLFGGKRVPKDSARVEAYGSVDELNSHIGLVRSLNPPEEIDQILAQIQDDLFVLGGDLATPREQADAGVPRIRDEDTTKLESQIDRIDAQLPPLHVFILPGGTVVAAHLHVARTICRRAERRVVTLAREQNIGTTPLTYLNRLADFLYVLARYANHLQGGTETIWHRLERQGKTQSPP